MCLVLTYIIHVIFVATVLYNVIQCEEKFDFFKEYVKNNRQLPVKPEKCYGQDSVLDERCCILPPFFSKEIALKCGTQGAIRQSIPEQNVTALARIGLSCESWTCILDQYHLLVEEHLDDRKFGMHLQRWVKLNPEFREVVVKARDHCRETHFVRFPLDPCHYKTYHFCYRNFITINCPVMVKSSTCEMQRKFYEDCREYFLKK